MVPHPSRKNFKQPTPDSEWRPEWRPRKREPGRRGYRANLEAIEAVAGKLCVPPETLEALPRREDGRPINSEELRAALQAFTVAGGTLVEFGRAVGLPRSTLSEWIRRTPGWADEYEDAKRKGADALVEEAKVIAESPQFLEEVFESYDGEGNLTRKDIRRADAVYARKLAVATKLDIAKKWAPDKYGDRVEIKTSESLAARILEARRRTQREQAEDISES